MNGDAWFAGDPHLPVKWALHPAKIRDKMFDGELL
jgi:hypothetical protein